MSDRTADVVVVGGGLIGLATARELLRRQSSTRLVLLEKEGMLANHQSGRNSGVIHSGIYYQPGSLKARLCVEGARRLFDYCDEHGVPYRKCGKLIVAAEEDELPRLGDLLDRGIRNGVPGLERLAPDGMRDIEAHVTGVAAIYSPSTGIIDYQELARALAAGLQAAGGRIITGALVTGIRRQGQGLVVQTTAGAYEAGALITCGGLHADRLARMTGAPKDPPIVPFRGEFWRLRAGREFLVRALIYPVPDPSFPFLGVHFTRRMSGEVWLGPNAVPAFAREGYRRSAVQLKDLSGWLLWPGFWRMAARYWRMGVAEIYRSVNRRALLAALRRYVPELRADDVVPAPAGVRAQAVSRHGELVDDFVFAQEEGILHVRNAPSPAATACLSIASRIVDQFAHVEALG